MDHDLQKAAALLAQGGYTCVLCAGDAVYTSDQRGIKPLLGFLDAGIDLRGFSAADKVVGKATAFLYCLLGVKAVYAPVISRAALDVLGSFGIEAQYDVQAEAILNHRKDGFCPMETATKALDDPLQALHAIRKTLEKLQ